MEVENQLKESPHTVIAHLLEEIVRYLAAVDTFRAEGVEPVWADERALPEWWLEEHLPRRKPEPELVELAV
jgi:hypothetical protein